MSEVKSIRNIRTDPDPILRKTSKAVTQMTPRTDRLIDDMINDLHAYDGVGLAAVQVGVLKRICVICIEEKYSERPELSPEELEKWGSYCWNTGGEDLVIINPEVTADSALCQTGSEGCLSFPEYYGKVTRPYYITLRALDRNLEPFTLKAAGLLARCICHEAEHMDGKLFVDRVEGGLYKADREGEEEE